MTYRCVLLLILLFCGFPGLGQKGMNLGFSERCAESSSGFCHWDRSWGKAASIQADVQSGIPCLFFDESDEQAVVFVEQKIELPAFEGPALFEFSLWVKTDNVEGKGAGLNLGAYDPNGQLVANQDMGGFYSLDWLSGTNEWKKLKLSMVCTDDMQYLKIGVILYGKGKLWCKDGSTDYAPIAKRKANGKTKKIIREACAIIEQHSLVRDSIDISSLERVACQVAGKSKTARDCDVAIRFLLESLRPYGDVHSFLMKAEEVKNWETEGSAVVEIEFPKYAVINRCGYVLVPPFHGGNQETITRFADSLQTILAYLETQNILGWIIDLRTNTGGNMEPMIVGLGPLFSAEKIGALIDVNGTVDGWHYAQGKYFWNSESGWELEHPVKLKSALPIAVLTSDQTGSSGEAVALSFVGNAHTRSFGQPTWGLTTGNGSFDLSDGSKMFLASTYMCDRNNTIYHGSIEPDVLCNDNPETYWDDVLDTAQTWILTQNSPLLTQHPEFRALYDEYQVDGAFLLLNLQDSSFASYNFPQCTGGRLPASTFKICNSLIGLETGVIPDIDFRLKWDGVKRNAVWDQDYALPGAFRNSVVWYYQEVARRIGEERMQNWLNACNYGNKNISGGIDQFWLNGGLRISAEQQVEFIRQLYRSELPFSQRSMDIVKSIMVADSAAGYTLRGKTGWGGHEDQDIGWYVGYLTRGKDCYIFANYVQAPSAALDELERSVAFDHSRREITLRILKDMGLLE